MNEIDVEKALLEFKDRIYVNNELKYKLRESFAYRKGPLFKGKIKLMALAAIICFIIAGYSIINSIGLLHVSAANLKVESYNSLMSIGDGRNITTSEYNGTIYMPGFERGILAFDSKGIRSLYKGNASSAVVSGSGSRIAFNDNGSIKIYNVESGKVDEILKGDETTASYVEPSWLSDESGILYTKNTLGKNEQGEYIVKGTEIYRYDFSTSTSTKVTNGTHGSFIKGRNSIVFEMEEKIFYKSLDDNKETVVEDGCYPSASPDGRYIAYIKTDFSTREIEKDVMVEQGLQNIYIADTDNLNVRKKVTFNIPLIDIDEKEWLANIDRSNPPNILANSGRYCYLYPSWSSDSKSIISIRKEYPSDPRVREIKQRMVRINLNKTEPLFLDIIKGYLRAKAIGDEDYASSIVDTEYQTEDLKGLKISCYKMIDSAMKNNYLDAEISYASLDNLYVKVEKNRYYTGDVNGGTVIKGKNVLSSTEISKEGSTIYMRRNGGEKARLISIEDVSKEYAEESSDITSIAYSDTKKMLYFTLLDGKNGAKGVKVVVYDTEAKESTIIDGINNQPGIKVTKLFTDSTGGLAALEYSTVKNEKSINTIKVYNINDKMVSNLNEDYKSENSDVVGLDFWDGADLVIRVSDGVQSMMLKYSPLEMRYKNIK